MKEIDDYCAICAEPIYEDMPRYNFPDGYVVCEECVAEFIDTHYREEGGEWVRLF